METLLSTDPQTLYTEECAALALNLPGTLADDPCASTVWNRTRTTLTFAACYPRLLASTNEFDTAARDMLTTAGVWGDFRDACKAAISLVHADKFPDTDVKACRTYVCECFPERAERQTVDWLIRETCQMKETYTLCRTFYFGTENEKMPAARKIVDAISVQPYTKSRLLKELVRAMMVLAHIPMSFGRLKGIFLKTVAMWSKLTARLESCAKVTLKLCGNVKPYLRVKLMASLLREVWTAGGITPNEFHLDDENLLLLQPDLSCDNVYFAPDITLVCNLKKQCVGVVHKQSHSDTKEMETGYFNMLAYAVMEAARRTNERNDSPTASSSKATTSQSAFRLKYVKVDGVPSDKDDVSDYMEICTLSATPANVYGFAIWNETLWRETRQRLERSDSSGY